VLLTGASNNGEASVSLKDVAPGEHATLRLVCGPADLAATSAEFRVTP
jgi:hypothetical protein